MLDELHSVVQWASIFDHSLTTQDLMRFIQCPTTEEELEEALLSHEGLTCEDGRWYIEESSHDPRSHARRRALASEHLHEVESVLATLIHIDAVLALAITGSVAAGVNEEDGDVDLLIIAAPGHTWRVRALVIHLEHHSKGGKRLCPNMVLDVDELRLRPSLYAASEMAMMIPIHGVATIQHLWAMNPWVNEMLPNARLKPLRRIGDDPGQAPWWWRWMRTPGLGRIIERWEASRRIRVLSRTSTSDEATYSRTRCIGHEHGHRARIEASMAELRATRRLDG